MLKSLKFLTIICAVSAPCAAYAQGVYDRYNNVLRECPYRAAMLNPAEKSRNAQIFNEMSEATFSRLLKTCRQHEANLPVPNPAPKDTLVAKPEGSATRIVVRPAGAPRGQYYRCNRQTLMPDPKGTSVCGPPR